MTWRHLPREARDTLFLLAVIAWTTAPHLPQLPLWCSLMTLAMLSWRAGLALTQAPLPPRRLLLIVLAVAIGLTLWSHHTLLGRDAGITLIVALMALKTLELRARRDAFVVFFLGFFMVLTQFLRSQSLGVALAMLVSVWGLLTALVLAHMPVGQPSLRQAATLSARTALFGAPVMALLFVLFPRIGPLWGVPQDNAASTGLSSTLSMGSVARIALDDGIAMRLRFDGQPPPRPSLYLRGPVLGSFDGREWKRLEPSFPLAMQPKPELSTEGPGIGYEITLEPLRLATLPLLEVSPDHPGAAPHVDGLRLRLSDDLQWLAERPVTERLRLHATAYTDFRHGPREAVIGLQDYIALPAGYNPRTLAWAASLRRDQRYAQADAQTLAAAVLRYISSAGFVYTLEPGTYGDATGRDAIDEFWLDRRQGFCEHFAAAFVVVMRALDVPARIVTGYQGADDAPSDGYLLVRNSNAHAWAEYWQPGRGWLRADPTAAVAPDRIGLGRSLVAPSGFMAGALQNVSPTLLADLRRIAELLGNRWNQWVLNYSRGQQLDLLRHLGFSSPDWHDLATVLVLALSSASALGAGWALWDRQRQNPWLRQAERARAALRRCGVATAAHEPPRALAARLLQTHGPSAAAAATLLERLDRQRYGPNALRRPQRAWLGEFRSALRGLPRSA